MTCKNNRMIFCRFIFLLATFVHFWCWTVVGNILSYFSIICYTFDICCTYRYIHTLVPLVILNIAYGAFEHVLDNNLDVRKTYNC